MVAGLLHPLSIYVLALGSGFLIPLLFRARAGLAVALFVLALAITQGAMYERSKVLLWVLLVHLIVDYFLYWQIVTGHYPDYVQTGILH